MPHYVCHAMLMRACKPYPLTSLISPPAARSNAAVPTKWPKNNLSCYSEVGLYFISVLLLTAVPCILHSFYTEPVQSFCIVIDIYCTLVCCLLPLLFRFVAATAEIYFLLSFIPFPFPFSRSNFKRGRLK